MTAPQVLRLPKLYENMDEATVGGWHVQVGEPVREGDVLVELITDKTVVEFESPIEGVLLAVYAPEKSTVPVGYAIAAIGPAGAQAPDVAAENEAKLAELSAAAEVHAALKELDAAKPLAAKKAGRPGSFRAAPAARGLARKHGIDLADVAAECGSEIIHKKDVEAFLARRAAAPADPTPAGTVPAVSSTAAGPADPRPLRGRIALVTGGAGGIGQAVCRRLAQAGADVVVHYRSNVEKAEALARELSAFGVRAQARGADIADPAQVKALIEQVAADLGGLHILVNNAGILDDGLISFMKDDQWRRVLAVNLDGPFFAMRAAAMRMARQRFGRIVNIASDAGRLGAANRSNYAAAKEGLVGLTRSAARELAGLGIRVNAVSPGFVETAMTEGLTDARRKELLRAIPVRRLGRPEEVAEAVLFLCLPQADYITGQVLFVDGGMFMG